MRSDIKKDFVWNTIGVFLQNAISPLLLVVITRINGIYDSGLFSFAFSVAIIFWAIGMWGGRTYQVSDAKHEFSHGSYIVARAVLAVAVMAGATLFIIINHYDEAKSSVILALVLFKIVESIADSIHGILQVHGRLHVVGKSLLYKAVGGFALFVCIDVLTRSILLSSLGVVIINVLVFLFYDWRIAKKLEDISIRIGGLSQYMKNAFAIIRRCSSVFIVMFLAMFSLNIPRYFIDLYHEEQNGYFGIITMPVTLIVLLMTFILQPRVVMLTKLYDSARYDKFNNVVNRLLVATMATGVVVFVSAMVAGIPILELVFRVDFSGYKAALMIIIAGAVANALVGIYINILTIMRFFKAQLYILLFTNIALVILSMSFINVGGLSSGAILFAAINLLQVLLLIMTYKKLLRGPSHVKEN